MNSEIYIPYIDSYIYIFIDYNHRQPRAHPLKPGTLFKVYSYPIVSHVLKHHKNKAKKFCLFTLKMMGPLFIPHSRFLSYVFLVLSAVSLHVQAYAWLNAHATFYGTNQNPTTLGMSCFIFNVFSIYETHYQFLFTYMLFKRLNVSVLNIF